jgi:hypothetical protein
MTVTGPPGSAWGAVTIVNFPPERVNNGATDKADSAGTIQ